MTVAYEFDVQIVEADWRERAHCKGSTRLFFPPKAERPQARARREAKAIRLCSECEVREPCQQSARGTFEYSFGVGESSKRHLAGFNLVAQINVGSRHAHQAGWHSPRGSRPVKAMSTLHDNAVCMAV